jgi:hypothetical protein
MLTTAKVIIDLNKSMVDHFAFLRDDCDNKKLVDGYKSFKKISYALKNMNKTPDYKTIELHKAAEDVIENVVIEPKY